MIVSQTGLTSIPIFFEQQAKLNKTDALQKIDFLRKAIDQRNTRFLHRREIYEKTQKNVDKKEKSQALYTKFKQIYGNNYSHQERGRLFEFFLRELFNQQSIQLDASFRLLGEEIDGTFKFEGENYLVEAKWEDAHTSTQKLYVFAHKTLGKLHGRGVFISVHGFSREGIQAIVIGKQIQTILIDGEDLSHVLEERITLEKLLDYKIKAAQTRGEVYVCPIRESKKI